MRLTAALTLLLLAVPALAWAQAVSPPSGLRERIETLAAAAAPRWASRSRRWTAGSASP